MRKKTAYWKLNFNLVMPVFFSLFYCEGNTIFSIFFLPCDLEVVVSLMTFVLVIFTEIRHLASSSKHFYFILYTKMLFPNSQNFIAFSDFYI